jgi:hypothetical protein
MRDVDYHSVSSPWKAEMNRLLAIVVVASALAACASEEPTGPNLVDVGQQRDRGGGRHRGVQWLNPRDRPSDRVRHLAASPPRSR